MKFFALFALAFAMVGALALASPAQENVNDLAARDNWQNKVIEVVVGENGGLTFNPDDIKADVGDTVRFLFVAKNHTVTESSFDSPCQKVHYGFDSDFQPIPADSGEKKIFDLKVTQVEKPIWFYCRQTGHCQMGMVGGINADWKGDKTVNAFRERARWSY